jgi:hypothetical protein
MDKSLVALLTTTLLTLGCWVGFEVYSAYFKVDVPAGLEKHMQPLNPNLKVSVLDDIEKSEP